VWSDPAAGDRPVGEWCQIWLDAKPVWQPATVRKIRGVIAKQIAGTFGRRPLVSVRSSEVQAWAADLSRTQSVATARHSLGVLRRVFDYAVRDGAIQRNPAAGIRLSKVVPRSVQRQVDAERRRHPRGGPAQLYGPRRAIDPRHVQAVVAREAPHASDVLRGSAELLGRATQATAATGVSHLSAALVLERHQSHWLIVTFHVGIGAGDRRGF
jgi:hypothetical protein